MKTLPTLAAVGIALALVLTPMVAAAGTTVSITSPASGTSYKNTGSYTISGTVSSSTSQADTVGIQVTNPNGALVDAYTATVQNPGSSGTFSYSTKYGTTSAWTSGTYTITATDGDTAGVTATATFSYTSASTGPGANTTKLLEEVLSNQTLIENWLKSINASITADHASDASILSQLSTISSNINTLQSDINSLTTTVGSINTAVNNMTPLVQQAATNANNAQGAVSSTQTYVLVVAVLAAITLVLELAILVRKIS